MKLIELDHIPDGLLERPASALHHTIDGPTLIHIEGKDKSPLFVSVLQHGNETSGWEAVRRLLKSHYEFDELPRSMSILIGNVQAAKHNLRRLDDQLDYNRCWPGGQNDDSELGKLFQQVTDTMRRLSPIASMDIHNNTGLNPHYAAINRVRPEFLRLATRFSDKVVYFTMPGGTQSMAFSKFCPAVTLECGQAADDYGTDHALAYIESCMQLGHIDTTKMAAEDVHLYHMVATVTVPDDVLYGFGQVPTDIAFPKDLDRLNFQEMPAGSSFGVINNPTPKPLLASNIDGEDVTSDFFRFDSGQLETIREVMPSMLTLDRRVIHQDCLCYLMERINIDDYAEKDPEDPLPESLRRSDRPK